MDYPYFVGGSKVRFTPSYDLSSHIMYMTGGSIMNSKKGVLTQATGLLRTVLPRSVSRMLLASWYKLSITAR